MILQALVVADPVGSVVELAITQCRRLAARAMGATNGAQTLALVEQLRPEVVVVALEINNPTVDKLVPQLIQRLPDVLIIATFRELTVPHMEHLNRLGVDDFVAQPINATEIFRAVARRFHLPFRQHHRFACHLDVVRADGVLLGHAVNISEGGLAMELKNTVQPDESVLVCLQLPDGQAAPLRTRVRILAVQTQPDSLLARGQFEMLRGAEQRRLVDYLAALESGLKAGP